MYSSYLQKFMFEQLPIKGVLVVLEDSWQTISNQHEYPAGLRRLLGELLAANTLLTSNLKLVGNVICQIQDNPHFNLVVSECSNEFVIRATAKFTANDQVIQSYSSYLEDGHLIVSVDSKKDGNLYQSVIAFNGDTISEILNNYMVQSEQLKSWFLLAYSEQRVVGFMLQQLPDSHNRFFDDIERIFILANTLTCSELLHNNLELLITKLFHEDNVVVFPEHLVKFGCSCSRSRVSEILCSLGKAELKSLIAEQGNITVDCDYCNAEYKFSEEELTRFVVQLSIEEMLPISEEIN